MKSKAILVSFLVFLALALTLNTVLASDFVSISKVEINDIVASDSSTVVAGEVSNVVPVEVYFKANEDTSDVRVEVSIDGYKDEIRAFTPRFHIINGSNYVKRFSLKLPSTMDMDNLDEGVTVKVEISSKDADSVNAEYTVVLQKDLYSLNILSVDSPLRVTAGSTVALDVVIENNGNERLNNVYVKASIPELGVERKIYYGDLKPVEQETYDNIRNANNKVVYLNVPRNAVPGTYNIIVEAYNYDTSTTVKQKIGVEGVQSGVLPATTSRSIAVGEETSFDVVLINPNDRMVVYSITPEQTKGLIVEVTEPIVTVGADSSRTVKVKVKATNSAEEGTHLVTVNVNTESGLERKVDFTVNVEKPSTSTGIGTTSITGNNTVLVLTVILVIIFVVLLIVLIVLLTKRPAETEEFGETSYY
ncbi:MAG: hypothetical protein Q8N99_02265 [Nanoarchaeota archaeon]|nr:hypothetical protein [Nanoarchaeota archaeon]